MLGSLPDRLPFAPSHYIHAASGPISILAGLLGHQGEALPIRPWLDTDGFLVDEARMCAAVQIEQIQRVAGEKAAMAAIFAFDKVGVLVPCHDRSAFTSYRGS